MSTGVIIAIVVGVILVLAIAGAVAMLVKRKQRSKKLEQRFGPEYDRALEKHDDKKEAEKSLEQRQERRERFETRELEPEQQEHFANEWRNVQSRFVDEPQQAVRESDHLVKEVMRKRGYPVDDFEQRAEDLSVDHPNLVENYRSAGEIAERNEQGKAETEDLRQATVHYRALFEELLDKEVTKREGQGGDHASDTGAEGRRGEEVR